MTLHKNYPKVHDYAINHVSVTRNNKWFFTSDRLGFLKQWDVEDGVCLKDYGKVHEKSIFKFSIQPTVVEGLEES